jgi:cytochrome d ubiquinol oxidase subunit I
MAMTLELSRRQFGITTVFHFMFVPLTIGLALLLGRAAPARAAS